MKLIESKKNAQIKSNRIGSKLWVAGVRSTQSNPPFYLLYILVTSGQSTWTFDIDCFWRRRTVDMVVIPSTLLNSIVTGQLQEHTFSGKQKRDYFFS